MQNLIVYALREEYEDFSGGSVSLVDGEEYDVFEALEAGEGRIVLGLDARRNEDDEVTEAEAVRSLKDAQIAEALKKYPALEPVEAEHGDEPLSYANVDVTMPAGPSLTQLRARAGELDIPGRSSMSKAALAEAIAEKEAALAAAPSGVQSSDDLTGDGEQSGDGDGNSDEGGEQTSTDGEGSTEGSGD